MYYVFPRACWPWKVLTISSPQSERGKTGLYNSVTMAPVLCKCLPCKAVTAPTTNHFQSETGGKQRGNDRLAAIPFWKFQQKKAQIGCINSPLRFQFLYADGSTAPIACDAHPTRKKGPEKQWKILTHSQRHYTNAVCSGLAPVSETKQQTGGQKDEMSSDIRLRGCGWLPLSCQCTTALPLSLFHFLIPSQAEAQSPREISHPAQCDEGNACVFVRIGCVCQSERTCTWKQDQSERQGERAK